MAKASKDAPQEGRRKSNFALAQLSLRIVKYTYIITYREWNPNPNSLQPNRSQHDRPATWVVAQQYSSATFVSLPSHSLKQKFGERFEKVISFLHTLLISQAWNCITWNTVRRAVSVLAW
jgi:hypothetical protein